MLGNTRLRALTRSGADGLSPEEAARRLVEQGPNTIPRPVPRSDVEVFLDQFRSLPVLILIGSAVLSAATGGLGDAVVIVAVVLVNGTIGALTERGSERTLRQLTDAEPPRSLARRGGRVTTVPTAELVVGDTLILTRGAYVGADARVLSAESVTVDESSLTGESMPVDKRPGVLMDPDVPLADRWNMVYRGTVITGGNGGAVVVATGRRTELGQIADVARLAEQPTTPLRHRLDELGRRLAVLSAVAAVGVAGVGLARGYPPVEMLRTAVALAVAAVPEGLPAVATVTLATGVGRMKEAGVLVRRLAAVETLGSLEVVCLDKTGTLTQNRMAAVAAHAGGQTYTADADWRRGATVVRPTSVPELVRLLEVAALCNETEVAVDEGGALVLRGTPTEEALAAASHEAGIDIAALRGRFPTIRTVARTEERAIMATIHEVSEDGHLVAAKGEPQQLLARCDRWMLDGEIRPLTDQDRRAVLAANDRFGADALRVLGVAYRDGNGRGDGEVDDIIARLVWLGLIGIADPPRPGMDVLISRLRDAGVATMMITGDQASTAQAVARQLGLGPPGSMSLLDSVELDRLDPAVLRSLVRDLDVVSRVSPTHKLRIVRALQDAGRIVAMTGDGINDGPAMKTADLGIAMGRSGTDIAREVADVVLLEDDPGALLPAIAEGRAVSEDIRKAIHYLVATNVSEILVMFTSIAAGLGQPFGARELLWINLLTDMFPDLALALDPPERDVMSQRPVDPHAPILGREVASRIGLEAGLMTSATLATYGWGRARYGPGPHAGALAFLTIVSSQLLHTIAARSTRHSIFDPDPLPRNPGIRQAIGAGFGVEIASVLVPPVRNLLGIGAVSPLDVVVAGTTSLATFGITEIVKYRMAHRLGAPPARRAAEPRGPDPEGGPDG
jgi:Ca2+-transporting ATPase